MLSCRTAGGFMAAKTESSFTVSPKIPISFAQFRSDRASRITFPIHSLPCSLRVSSRPGFGSGPFSTRALFEDSVTSSKPCTFYELLGISETGTLSEIKQAYKQLARKYHPDVSPPDRVQRHTEKFIQVHEAYETLSDPNKRALYDMDLAMGIHNAFGPRKRYPNYEEVCAFILLLLINFLFLLKKFKGLGFFFFWEVNIFFFGGKRDFV